MSRGSKSTTIIVNSVADVPEGYERLATFRDRVTGNWPTVQKALSEAHQRGEIRAVKVCRTLGDLKVGAVHLHRGDADAFLRERDAKAAADRVRIDIASVEASTAATVVESWLPPKELIDNANEIASLRVEIASLRESVADLRSAVADLVAAVQLRTESEMVAACQEDAA